MKKRVIVGVGLVLMLSGCLTVVPEGAPAQPILEPVQLSDDAATSYDFSEVNDIHVVTPNEQTSKLYNISKNEFTKEFKRKNVNVSVTKQEEFDAPSENGTLTVYLSTTTDTIPYVSNVVSENTDSLDEDTAVIQSAIDQRGENVLIVHGGKWGVREATDLIIDEKSISLESSSQMHVNAVFNDYKGVYTQSNGELEYEVIQGENDTEVIRYIDTETRQEITLNNNVTVSARKSSMLITPISAQETTEYKSIPVIEIKNGSIDTEVNNEASENTTESNTSTETELNTSTKQINRTTDEDNASDTESQVNTTTNKTGNTTNNSTINEELTNKSETINASTKETTNASKMNSTNTSSGNETKINSTR